MKLFVDANTLISGLLYEGNERILLELGRFGSCELFTNDYVHDEVAVVLGRPRLRFMENEQHRLMTILDRSVVVLKSPSVEEVRKALGRLEDPDDLPVLVGFEGSGCDYFVTGDKALRLSSSKAITTRRALELLLGEFE